MEFFEVNFSRFYSSHFSSVSLTESCSFWLGLKDLVPLTSSMTKLSLYVKSNGAVTGTREVDLYRQLQVVQGQMGFKTHLIDV